MNIKDIFDKYSLDKEKLVEYGFVFNNNYYELKKELNDILYAIFKINDKNFIIKVYDVFDDEEYLPFTVKNSIGSYVSEIRETVDIIKNDIIKKCFQSSNIRDSLISYFIEKYNTEPEYLWERTPNGCIFRTNKKWYGIIMNVPYKSLGIDKDGVVDIINLKNSPDKITKLIDNENYLKAYHMNKKYWITILINNSLNLEEVKKLIDESYDIVNGN